MRSLLILGFLLTVLPSAGWAAPEANPPAPSRTRSFRINVSVTDLRRNPTPPPLILGQDLQEESQLLYGDPVALLGKKEGWTRVAAMKQLEWNHNQRWEGYPGWILTSSLIEEPEGWTPNLVISVKLGKVFDKPEEKARLLTTLSLGTKLRGEEIPAEIDHWRRLELLDGTTGWIREKEATPLTLLMTLQHLPIQLRAQIVETARLFLGDPYYWGGRSAHNPDASVPPHTAVDCSGLVGLAYQANGLTIPRDAHEQWMQAKPIEPESLSPGDLIFLHDPKNPDQVTHVMMVTGKGRIIEGPGTGKTVWEIGQNERLQQAKGRRISFGTYFY